MCNYQPTHHCTVTIMLSDTIAEVKYFNYFLAVQFCCRHVREGPRFTDFPKITESIKMISWRKASIFIRYVQPLNQISNAAMHQICHNRYCFLKLQQQTSLMNIGQIIGAHRRSLYTEDALGINEFMKMKQKTHNLYPPEKAERLQQGFAEGVADSNTRRHGSAKVFPEDFIRAVFLCQKDDAQTTLIKGMTTRLCQQSSCTTFINYNLGPLLMRLCYTLDLPDLALELVSTIPVTYVDMTTYQVLLTILYRHERYEEVLAIVERIRAGRLIKDRFPRTCMVLGLAAALKIGSPEGYERGLALARTSANSNTMPRRFYALSGTLALVAGRPDLVLSLLHDNRFLSYYTINNSMLLALCQLGQLQQVLVLLRPIMVEDSSASSMRNPTEIFRDTYDAVKAAFVTSQDPALLQEFAMVERALLDRGLVTDKRLVDCVLEPLDKHEHGVTKADLDYETAFFKGSYIRFENMKNQNRAPQKS